MKLIMENWNKFLKESNDILWSSGVWGIQLLQGHTKSKKWHRIVHIPSGAVIPTDYYKSKKVKDVKDLINFLNTHNWPDINSPNPSPETISDIHDTIINSDFKRDAMIYVSAKTGEKI